MCLRAQNARIHCSSLLCGVEDRHRSQCRIPRRELRAKTTSRGLLPSAPTRVSVLSSLGGAPQPRLASMRSSNHSHVSDSDRSCSGAPDASTRSADWRGARALALDRGPLRSSRGGGAESAAFRRQRRRELLLAALGGWRWRPPQGRWEPCERRWRGGGQGILPRRRWDSRAVLAPVSPEE